MRRGDTLGRDDRAGQVVFVGELARLHELAPGDRSLKRRHRRTAVLAEDHRVVVAERLGALGSARAARGIVLARMRDLFVELACELELVGARESIREGHPHRRVARVDAIRLVPQRGRADRIVRFAARDQRELVERDRLGATSALLRGAIEDRAAKVSCVVRA